MMAFHFRPSCVFLGLPEDVNHTYRSIRSIFFSIPWFTSIDNTSILLPAMLTIQLCDRNNIVWATKPIHQRRISCKLLVKSKTKCLYWNLPAVNLTLRNGFVKSANWTYWLITISIAYRFQSVWETKSINSKLPRESRIDPDINS